MNHILIRHQIRNARVQFGNRIRLIKLKHFLAHLRPKTEAVPNFALQILVAAKQNVARLFAQHNRQHRLRLTETGEVIKMTVPAIVVMRIRIARRLRRRGQQHDAFFQVFGESLAAISVDFDVGNDDGEGEGFALHGGECWFG